MIQHIVMLQLKSDFDHAELAAVMQGLSQLQIAGFSKFEHGTNKDYERKSQDYPYGFICSFDDEAALKRYASDPDHQTLGGRLVNMCEGGAEGIMVMDLAV